MARELDFDLTMLIKSLVKRPSVREKKITADSPE